MDDKPDTSPPWGICETCGETCWAKLVDYGFGETEYGSSREVDHNWQWVSPCCEAEVIELKKTA